MMADAALLPAATAAYQRMIDEEVATHLGMDETGLCGCCGARRAEVEDRVIRGDCPGSRAPIEQQRAADRLAIELRLGLWKATH